MTGRNAKRNQVNSLNSFLIIQAKLKLILHKEFGLKESSTFFHVLDQILEYPFFSDIKKDIPYLRELYKDMNRDPAVLRSLLELIQATLNSRGFHPNKYGRYPHI
jgi:hypothetical protein